MASIDKRPNGTWRACWREYTGGPQKSKAFGRKVDAEQYLVKVQHDLMTGSYIDPAKARTTVAEFYSVWTARRQWRQSTRVTVEGRFRTHVLPELGDRPLGSIRRGDVEAWLAGRRLVPSTAGVALQQLSSMLEAAVGDGLIPSNPARGIKAPRRDGAPVVPFTADQVDRLLEVADPAFAVAIALGVRCGLRHAEAAGVTVDRVDWLRRELKVDRQLVTARTGGLGRSFGPLKTANSYRTVPLADSTVAALAAAVERQGTGEHGLLVHDYGQPLNAPRFGAMWRRARGEAGLAKGARFHDLRHTFASVLLSNGVSVAATAEYLGDTPAVVLGTYAHLMPADHDRARGAVEAAFAGARLNGLRTG